MSHRIKIENSPKEERKGLQVGDIYQASNGSIYMLIELDTAKIKSKANWALLNLNTGNIGRFVSSSCMEIELDIDSDIDTEPSFEDGPFKRLIGGTELKLIVHNG